jgi:hypothetical protein
MKRPETRHYTEEEILLCRLGEVPSDMASAISAHLRDCHECAGVSQEFKTLEESVGFWAVPQPDEAAVQSRKALVLAQYRLDLAVSGGRESRFRRWARFLQSAWDYALENPLPTIGYIAIGLAFASERTIDVFHLERILPATNEVFELLRQIF